MLNKTAVFTIFLVLLTISTDSRSNIINNGDFGRCDYSYWDREVDFATTDNSNNEFQHHFKGGGCHAVLRSDYTDTQTDQIVSLQQSFLFTAGSVFDLSFDLASLTEAIAPNGSMINEDIPESVDIGLRYSGTLYNEQAAIGPIVTNWRLFEDTEFQRFSYELNADDFLEIHSGEWQIVFNLERGKVNGGLSDQAGSSLLIDNITISERVVAKVSEPQPGLLFFASLFILMLVRSQSSKQINTSYKQD